MYDFVDCPCGCGDCSQCASDCDISGITCPSGICHGSLTLPQEVSILRNAYMMGRITLETYYKAVDAIVALTNSTRD